MAPELYHEIKRIIAQERFVDAGAIRGLITPENAALCGEFYEMANDDDQRELVIIIFCSVHITNATQRVAFQYLQDVPDKTKDIDDATHITRTWAICSLEGSFFNEQTYNGDLNLRKRAEEDFFA